MTMDLLAPSEVHYVDWELDNKEVKKDPKLGKLFDQVLKDPSSHPDCTVCNWQLLCENCLILVATSTLLLAILCQYHDLLIEEGGGGEKVRGGRAR